MSSARSLSSVDWFIKALSRGLLLALVISGSLSAGERLTLADSLDRASKNNPELLLAGKDLAVARTQVRQAKSLFYPKVNLNLDYVRYRNETLGITNPELGNIILEAPIQPSKDEPRGNPLAQNLYMGRLGFVQTLYAGGKLTATHRLSQAGLRRAENMVETVRHEVECETADHFYHLLALQKKEQVLSDALLEIGKLSNQATNAHSRLALAATQAETRKRLSNLHQEKQSIQFKYLQVMGLELFSAVEVEGTLEIHTTLPDLQTVLVWAKQNRAELKETQIQEELDQLSIELSRSERYPVFLLGGSFEQRHEEFPLEDTNWNTSVSMNIPIFDGFSSYARIKESRYRADQGRLRRVQLEDKVEMEVRTAHSEWAHWNNEVDARRQQLKMLEDLRRSNFSLPQRLDFLRWRSDASASLIDAQYELCAVEARLSKAVGRSVSKINAQ